MYDKERSEVTHSAMRYDDFKDVYRPEVIARDQEEVRKIRARLKVEAQRRERMRSFAGVENAANARDLEYSIAEMVNNEDLFAEWQDDGQRSLIESETDRAIGAVMTLEFDDYKNHIDIICVAQNALTEGRAVPFFLNATYNSRLVDLDKKFDYRHFRYPEWLGLATAKYYEDLDSFEEQTPNWPKGRIEVAPRFVVGYGPDLADDQSEKGLDRKKLCLLTELTMQSQGMLRQFERARAGALGRVALGVDEGDGGVADDSAVADGDAAVGVVVEGAAVGGDGDLRRVYRDLRVLNRYFGRARKLFLEELQQKSQAQSELPASRYYGDAKGYQRSIESILHSQKDMAFQAIRGEIETIYP